jgi:hypothetical protein
MLVWGLRNSYLKVWCLQFLSTFNKEKLDCFRSCPVVQSS